MTQPNNHHVGPRPLQRGWDDKPPNTAVGHVPALHPASDAEPAPEAEPSRGEDSTPLGLAAVPWAPRETGGPSTALPWTLAPVPTPMPTAAPASAPSPPPERPSTKAPSEQAHVPQPGSGRQPGLRGATTGAASNLSYDLIVRSRSDRPTTGWRGAVYTMTRGRWNPGLSAAEAERRQKISRIRSQLAGSHTITVASMKGGVGKTTVSALLGLVLAEHRGDRVVALDANPDAGTLAARLLGQRAQVTLRDLINNLSTIHSLTDINGYTHLAGRLQVLASEQDPAKSESFNRDEYEQVTNVLKRFFNIIITDSGTGLTHSAMAGALETTRSLVIVGAPTVDAAELASRTLDWISARGFEDLVDNAVVALSFDRYSRDVDRSAVIEHFASCCRAVVEIPEDRHLATGGHIQLEHLQPRTLDAALTLAAHVADEFIRTPQRAEPLSPMGQRG